MSRNELNLLGRALDVKVCDESERKPTRRKSKDYRAGVKDAVRIFETHLDVRTFQPIMQKVRELIP